MMQYYKMGDWQKINNQKIETIQYAFKQWYLENFRKLPWRQTSNPYYIWVSEVMLQQTRVDTVIPYFERFIHQFPTIECLAEADEGQVLKVWEGLGYYSRARNLLRGAKMIVSEYAGKIPNTLNEIKKIPGIGSYTAGAILSIAFGQAIPAVDGNVMRVFSRMFCIQEDIQKGKTKKEMEAIGYQIIPKRNPSLFNQALMELGALICTVKSPRCTECPVFRICKARMLGIEENLPIKKKKAKIKEVQMEVGVVWNHEKLLICKRPKEGLLANLWSLPSVERGSTGKEGEHIRIEIEKNYQIQVQDPIYAFKKEHIFTHLKWKMRVYFFHIVRSKNMKYPETQWISLDAVSQYAFPTAFMKIIKEIINLY